MMGVTSSSARGRGNRKRLPPTLNRYVVWIPGVSTAVSPEVEPASSPPALSSVMSGPTVPPTQSPDLPISSPDPIASCRTIQVSPQVAALQRLPIPNYLRQSSAPAEANRAEEARVGGTEGGIEGTRFAAPLPANLSVQQPDLTDRLALHCLRLLSTYDRSIRKIRDIRSFVSFLQKWRQRPLILESTSLPDPLKTVWVAMEELDVVFYSRALRRPERRAELVLVLAHLLLDSLPTDWLTEEWRVGFSHSSSLPSGMSGMSGLSHRTEPQQLASAHTELQQRGNCLSRRLAPGATGVAMYRHENSSVELAPRLPDHRSSPVYEGVSLPERQRAQGINTLSQATVLPNFADREALASAIACQFLKRWSARSQSLLMPGILAAR